MQGISPRFYVTREHTFHLLTIGLQDRVIQGIVARDARWYRRGEPKAALLGALPWLLLLSFLVFPMVSSSSFQAFSCEAFSNGRSYLRADYAIECHTEEHRRVEQLAWLGIFLYPVGVSTLYAVLLMSARHAIWNDGTTALSQALGFLVRDFQPEFMWWELLILWRQLWLVGFAILIMPGIVRP